MNSVEQSAGHRKRLRERFLKGGLAGFADYEIVELLLSLGTPRKDVKAEAKEALKLFKTLRGVLSATPEEDDSCKYMGLLSRPCQLTDSFRVSLSLAALTCTA